MSAESPTSDTEVPMIMADDAPGLGLVQAEEEVEDGEGTTILGPLSTGHPSIWRVKWIIPNFSKLNMLKMYSPRFTVWGHTWCILLFPQGMANQNPPKSQLAIFLDSKHMHSDPRFSCTGVFELTVENTNSEKTVTKALNHKFTCEEGDWGFQNFLQLSDLEDKEKGDFLPNDTMTILVLLRVIKDEEQRDFKGCEPELWLHDPKSETGFVGLQNQGATCYMNSLLQALYHVPYLRKAVYQMPTEDEIRNKDEVENNSVHRAVVVRQDKHEEESVALALQRVFFKLQHSSTSVETKQLTRSFGWDSHDAFTQHDVQELDRVLCDNLEEKMKGTPVEGVVPQLLRGKLKNYVRCLNVEYTSERIEEFYDLSLNVRGCKNVLESLGKYVEKEKLDGDNKYMAEGHGLQDAEKGCTFQSLPPILHLHLKRFEYDPLRDANVKVNDRFEFDEEIDLTGFEEGSEGHHQLPLVYKLHSVLVHSGDMHSGHYFSFVRPDCETKWFKFNDERVSPATESEAIDQNFGSSEEAGYKVSGPRRNLALQKKFNAYMLVYVRASEIPKLLAPLTKDDIPQHLRKRFEKEEREQLQAPHKIKVSLVDETDLREHFDSGFVKFENVMVLSMMKTDTVAHLKTIISEIKGVPVEQQRLWTFAMRENNTIRIDRALLPEDDDSHLIDVQKQSSPPLRMYLEKLTSQKPLDKRKDVLIAIKKFDAHKQLLKYVGTLLLPVSTLVGDLVEVLEKRLFVPETEEFVVWEEITPDRIEEPEPEKTLLEAKIGNGDILVVQKRQKRPFDEVADGAVVGFKRDRDGRCRSVPDYYDYLQHRVTVRVRKLEQPDRDLFSIELSMKHYYKQVARALANKMLETGHLKEPINPLRIMLYKHHPHLDRPQDMPAQRSTTWQLEEIIPSYHKEPPIIYVEVLGYSLQDLETHMLFKMRCPAARKEHGDKDHEVLVPKQSTTGEAINALKKALPSIASANLVLCWVQDHKIVLINKPGQPLEDVSGRYPRGTRANGSLGGHHYALELPDSITPDEMVSASDDGASVDAGVPGSEGDASSHGRGWTQPVWKVCHLDVERNNKSSAPRFHGDPFLISVHPNETVKSFKERLPTILQGEGGEGAANWGIRKVSDIAGDLGPIMDPDQLLVSASDNHHEIHICLQHPEGRDKYASNTNRPTERAIKILR